MGINLNQGAYEKGQHVHRFHSTWLLAGAAGPLLPATACPLPVASADLLSPPPLVLLWPQPLLVQVSFAASLPRTSLVYRASTSSFFPRLPCPSSLVQNSAPNVFRAMCLVAKAFDDFERAGSCCHCECPSCNSCSKNSYNIMCTIRTNILVLLLHIDSVLNILYHNNLLIAYNITYNIKDCMLGIGNLAYANIHFTILHYI